MAAHPAPVEHGVQSRPDVENFRAERMWRTGLGYRVEPAQAAEPWDFEADLAAVVAEVFEPSDFDGDVDADFAESPLEAESEAVDGDDELADEPPESLDELESFDEPAPLREPLRESLRESVR